MRKAVCYGILVCLMLGLCSMAQAAAIQTSLAGKLIRLHVVANSDLPEDQQIKLAVRDRVVECVQQLTADCTHRDQAEARLRENLPAIEQTAVDALKALGRQDQVQVTLGEEAFPTRYYDTFTLPAGSYRSLRVTIGAGEGHNWWCVAFPSLCFAATAEQWQQAAQTADFTQAEESLISGGEEEYSVRFLSLELLERFWDWLTS